MILSPPAHDPTAPFHVQITIIPADGNASVAEEQSEFHIGDADPDVIIPDKIARPLLVSSNLMLIAAALALRLPSRSFTWPLAAAATFVWVTSLLHWYAPRFSSWRRKLDYIAVCTYVGVGTWLAAAYARSIAWTAFYFTGLAVIGVIFTCNETLYYFQLQRTPVGGRFTAVGTQQPSDALPPSSAIAELARRLAPPATTAQGRRCAYRRTVWVHLLCVHVLASVLVCVMLEFGLIGLGGLPAD